MSALISWYIVITILGWLTFPLAYTLFPALSDRGYTLSRAFGLLIWGYVFWLFASLGIAQNDAGGLLLALLVLIGLSVWAAIDNRNSKIENRKFELFEWLSQNRRIIVSTELLFLTAFALMAWVRANNPEIFTAGGEKWMETAFINAILHSPAFPPHDPWLSGYAISYYYFGYVMTGMLAMLTFTPAPIAHNLMLSLIFALSAVGAYGLLYNLLRRIEKTPVFSAAGALFAPLFLLVVSNLEGVFESLHSKGIGWTIGAGGTATSSFWTWVDLQVISKTPPTQPFTWAPHQFFWWWRSSRVIMDYDLTGKWMGDIIDEFPFFSYLLGDLHPHVLAMPFNLLAIAVALNLFFGGWRGRINLFFGELRISKTGFFTIALVLGGLAFLNTWDILLGAALIVFSYALAQVHELGWDWERIEDVLLLGIPAGVTAFLMYLPFFVGFDSQAGGILPNFVFISRGTHLWIMWGTLFIPIFGYLFYLLSNRTSASWGTGIFSALGLVVVLILSMFVIGLIGLKVKPDEIQYILDAQGRTLNQFISEGMLRRLTNIGSLITLLALLIPTFAFLFKGNRLSEDDLTEDQPSTPRVPASKFVLLLVSLGTLLILGPEFLYLRDNFLYRINTVFKFYYQAWILLSIAAAYGTVLLLGSFQRFFKLIAVLNRRRSTRIIVFSIVSAIGLIIVLVIFLIDLILLRRFELLKQLKQLQLRRHARVVSGMTIVLVLVAGLVYPSFSIPSKTDDFKANNPEQRTLDGSAYLASSMSDDYRAFQFMQALNPGVVAEAVGGQYSEYARVSTFTGMPAVLGWPGHEGQWRDNSLQGSRMQDIETLYTTSDWFTAQDILKRYNIRYVYIGNLERGTYPVNEEKFNTFLKPIYQQGSVTIYEVY